MSPDPRYKNPASGTEDLVKYKDYWSLDLNAKSTQASYAVIAAAWAVYGGDNGSFFSNNLALFSVSVALVHIGITLIIQLVMVELLTTRFWFAQRHSESWGKEWDKSDNPDSFWPFNSSIQYLGRVFHWLKVIFPVLAATSLIFSFFCH